MTYTVLGVFENQQNAESAIKQLEASDYNPKDVSILMKDMREGQQVEKHTGAKVTGSTLSGAGTGIVIGGIAGLVAAMFIPGLGAFFIGGPIASAMGLTGAAASTVSGAVTGLVAGGIIGLLMGFGLSRRDAQTYEKRINQGAMLVAVPARESEEANVEEILRASHADTIKSVVLKEPVRREEARQEEFAQPDGQYRQPAYSYAGTKGGRAKETAKRTTGQGRGWHGDPEGHAKAGKGEMAKKK